MEILFYILLFLGVFINFISIVGLMKFPDVYTKLHAATKTTTFGSIFIIAAIVVMNFINYQEESLTIIIHSIGALLVIIFTNPISAHAIARAAMLSGIKPYGAQLNEHSDRFKHSEGINSLRNKK